MLWGRTYKERDAEYYGTRRWFAWRPVILEDGQWAWWVWVIQSHDDNGGVFFHHKYKLTKGNGLVRTLKVEEGGS